MVLTTLFKFTRKTMRKMKLEKQRTNVAEGSLQALQNWYTLYDAGDYKKLSTKLSKYEKNYVNNYFFWYLRAQTAKQLSRYKLAESFYSKALKLDPKNLNLLSDLSAFFKETGQLEKSLKCAIKYTEIDPQSAQGFCLVGQIFLTLQDYERAETSFNIAKELSPNDPKVLKSLGRLFIELGQYQDAIKFLEALFEQNEIDAEIGNNLILAYRMANRLKDASRTISILEEHNSQNIGESNLAQQNFNYSLVLLSEGDCKSGWERYQRRFDAPGFTSEWRNYKIPRLLRLDQAKGKTVLIWPEQGVGDQLTSYGLLAYFHKVSEANLVCMCDPRLLTILQRSFSEIEFLEDDADEKCSVQADFHLPLGDFGPLLMFDKTKSNLAAPYIKTETDLKNYWSDVITTDKLNVGLAWESGFRTLRRNLNYTKLNDWESLILDEKIRVINLQYGINEKEFTVKEQSLFDKVFDPEFDLKNDFENLSALLKNLDVVVSPTSAIMSHADACDVKNISYTSYVFDKALGNIFEERFIKIPWLTNNKVFMFEESNKRQVLDEIISEVRALVAI